MPDENGKFEGWAKIEIMGHQSHIGLVSTHVFGDAVLLRVDSPEVPEREETLAAERWNGHGYFAAGSVVKHPAIPATSVLLGAKSVYRIQPCTEDVAIRTIIAEQPRALSLVRAPIAAIAPPKDEDFHDDDERDPYGEDRIEEDTDRIPL